MNYIKIRRVCLDRLDRFMVALGMILFCLLWIPLFYLFWRSINDDETASGEVWAFILGAIAAGLYLFFGPIIEGEGFGFSRLLSGAIDIVVLPAILPFLLCFLFARTGIIKENANYTNFALIWILPMAILRAFTWSTTKDPIFLVLVPLLWTAIAVGIPLFISLILSSRIPWLIILGSLGILTIPFSTAWSYWAFYVHRTFLGYILLLAAVAPGIMNIIFAMRNETS